VTLKAIAYATLTIALLMLVATTASAQDAPFVRDVFNRINGQRTRNGLKACTSDKTLESAAQRVHLMGSDGMGAVATAR
jgi:uncharacterized protein YkwD